MKSEGAGRETKDPAAASGAPMVSPASKFVLLSSGLAVLVALILRTAKAPLTIDGWTLLYIVVGAFLLTLPSLLPSIQTFTVGKDSVSVTFFKRLQEEVQKTSAKVDKAAAVAEAAAIVATENNELLQDKEARDNAEGSIGSFERDDAHEAATEVPITKRADYRPRRGVDPNKGRFGGKSHANNRELVAAFAPIQTSKGERMRVTLRVKSTDPLTPLEHPVTFFLHPTFRSPEVRVFPRRGVASLSVIAWGAFTVGAEVDDARTRLELNLARVPGVPRWFATR